MMDELIYKKTRCDGNNCVECDIKYSGRWCPFYDTCSIGYNYKLAKEEPEEILSEYKWKKERYKNLKDLPYDQVQAGELARLEKWLEENKPERWEVCSRDNTKARDEVRVIGCGHYNTIDHIFSKKGQKYNEENVAYDSVASNRHGSYPTVLARYEINTYKENE